MARCAGAALLAAIEIYNKPTVGYREQTFAMLITNAWEVLLKARIVQLAGGRLHAIYRRERGSNRIDRDRETQDPRTITMRQCLSIVPLPVEVAGNIKGLVLIRNNAVHLGILASETRVKKCWNSGLLVSKTSPNLPRLVWRNHRSPIFVATWVCWRRDCDTDVSSQKPENAACCIG